MGDARPTTLIDRLQSGAITATAAVEACLSRIDAVDGRVGAFVTVAREAALAAADAADRALAAGHEVGPLHGLPVGLKDNIDTAGLRTTAGSAFLLDNVPTEDAEVVLRLRVAGAIVVGKVTMHELAFGATSQNVHTGVCRNPWDLTRIPGGSSGGSGAAVAADEVPVTLGTDTGGSIRIPGAVNGVVGLRPTSGRVSSRGIFPVAPTFDTCAPLAWDAIDVARVLTAIAGYDPGDPVSVDVPSRDYADGIDAGVDGLRVGVVESPLLAGTDPGVATAVAAAADVLLRAGRAARDRCRSRARAHPRVGDRDDPRRGARAAPRSHRERARAVQRRRPPPVAARGGRDGRRLRGRSRGLPGVGPDGRGDLRPVRPAADADRRVRRSRGGGA